MSQTFRGWLWTRREAFIIAVPTTIAALAAQTRQMTPATDLVPVTIAVSDQTRQGGNRLRVAVDGRTVIEHLADAAGGWKEAHVELARGRHSVTVTALPHQATATREFEITGPLWITLMLFPLPDGWRIGVHDRPVGLL